MRLERRQISAGAISVSGRAELTDARIARPRLGRCAVPEPPDGEATWLDAGETITLVRDGATPIVLTRATLGELVVYGADGIAETAAPEDEPFDVTLAGSTSVESTSWDDGVVIPAAPLPGTFLDQIGFEVEQPLTWTPAGADEVVIEIGTAGHVDLLCRAKDDGEFVLSPEENGSVPSTGTLVFRALRRSTASLDGRTVFLEGHQAVVYPY